MSKLSSPKRDGGSAMSKHSTVSKTSKKSETESKEEGSEKSKKTKEFVGQDGGSSFKIRKTVEVPEEESGEEEEGE